MQVALLTAQINHLQGHFKEHARITTVVVVCCAWFPSVVSCWTTWKRKDSERYAALIAAGSASLIDHQISEKGNHEVPLLWPVSNGMQAVACPTELTSALTF